MVIVLPGIYIQRIFIRIANIGATHFNINILVAIIIQVNKRNPMAFLQVANPRRYGNIGKALTGHVFE